MEIIRACQAGEDVRQKMSELFADGFYQWLRFFSKDKETLARAFAHMFELTVFYLAVENGRVMGMAACAKEDSPCIRLDKKEFRRHFGMLKGFLFYRILHKEFETKKYPFPQTGEMGMVEFVATAAEMRGKGVAGGIIRHIFEVTPHSEYVLEVADTNEKAFALYKRLGFREFLRIAQRFSGRSGVNELVYMKYVKQKGETAQPEDRQSQADGADGPGDVR